MSYRLVPVAGVVLATLATPLMAQAPRALAAPQDTSPPARERVAPPEVALARRWMSLDATGVDVFRRAQPTADGRGVLIAILDSGIDAGIPGLGTTSDGQPKLLDLRDFSGEGRVALAPVSPDGDTLTVGDVVLTGLARVASRLPGQLYAGTLDELALGVAPAADVNGNGSVRDHLPVVVGRASDGWVLYADANGNGTLADDRPVHDYLVARETFGWSTRGSPPLTVAANFSGDTSQPLLDLFFDTSAHGSHVAGIAAGHDIYGTRGLDGVAPGARLLGLKIANDAQGGISTTDAMRQAMAYAIAFARTRGLPLVMNLSFGVGNEREGSARIDAIVDSVLEANPEVVFAISAGNDGPGLSTIGFPGSARRALTVGAVLPGRFVPVPMGARPAPDAVAYFSSRGGEVAKPDLVTPGVAYSTVPVWDRGGEIEGGTSMASPHAAGLAALLLSAAAQAHRQVTAAEVRQALMVTAGRLPAAEFPEQGAGIPDVGRAWRWLQLGRIPATVEVTSPSGRDAALVIVPPHAPAPPPVSFTLRKPAGPPDTFALRSSAAWLGSPASVVLADSATVPVAIDSAAVGNTPASGVISGWTRDTIAGPAFRLVTTVVRALGSGAQVLDTLAPGQVWTAYFSADSDRPLNVRVSASTSGIQAFLHEPGGMPFRDGASLEAGSGANAAFFRVDGRDSRAGFWQVGAAAAAQPAIVATELLPSPARLWMARRGDSVLVRLASASDRPISARAYAGIVGAEWHGTVAGSGSSRHDIPVEVPDWARYMVVDVAMTPAQWDLVTDFGVSVFDSAGAQLEQSPLNYAEGRLHHAFPEPGGRVTLGLFPGFADASGSRSWSAAVTLRFYADEPVPLTPGNGAAAMLAPGQVQRLVLPWMETGWAMPAGAVPLGVVTIETAAGDWTQEAPLAAQAITGTATQ